MQWMFYISARSIMRQIVEGLIYLHENRILHRDISLTNILLTKDLSVVCLASSSTYHSYSMQVEYEICFARTEF